MLTKLLLAVSLISMVESLRCVYGGHGTVNGRSGAAPVKNITCASDTHYCVSLDSDVIFNGEHVKGIAKGCDKEMPGSTLRVFCKAEGCSTEKESNGEVKVCCCKQDYCNGTTNNMQLTFLMPLLALLLLAFSRTDI